MERNTGDEMAYTDDVQLNDDSPMLWMDGTAGFATGSPQTGNTVYADAGDLVFSGPADVDDEEDDLEDDEDLDEEDEDDEEDDLDEDEEEDQDGEEDADDLDEEDAYEDEEEDEDEDEDDE